MNLRSSLMWWCTQGWPRGANGAALAWRNRGYDVILESAREILTYRSTRGAAALQDAATKFTPPTHTENPQHYSFSEEDQRDCCTLWSNSSSRPAESGISRMSVGSLISWPYFPTRQENLFLHCSLFSHFSPHHSPHFQGGWCLQCEGQLARQIWPAVRRLLAKRTHSNFPDP